MYISRILNLKNLLSLKSHFLFGPRSTGKTNLIKHQLNEHAHILDLLNSELYLRLSAKPWELKNIVSAHADKIIVLDEIQRIPELLNEVHRLIEERKMKFLLTGSSARKLKKQGINLLAGRAWKAELFPLVTKELDNFSLTRYLRYGGLPQVYLSTHPEDELVAYVDTYLREEIQAEAAVRNLQGFSRFLTVAALTSGKMLNFSSLSNDVALPATTVREYYQVLEDTLVGFLLTAWNKSVKRKPISTAKFYLFDIGVRHQLMQIQSLEPQSDLFGQAFEHFIATELRAFLSYHKIRLGLSYWQSKNGQEVDFIIGDDIAIEVKSSDNISSKHLKNLKALAEEHICKKFYLISMDPLARVESGIQIMPWHEFLKDLWNGKIAS